MEDDDLEFNPEEMALWEQMDQRAARKTVIQNDAGREIIDSDNYCGRPVLGKIVVLPRSALFEFHCEKPWACISISGSNEILFPHIDEVNRVDLLRLQFDDIEFERPGTSLKTITPLQAGKILDFAENNWNRIDLLMIHCMAGISRSTACGKVISEMLQPEWAGYFSQLYSPNPLVCEMLRRLM